MYCPQLLSSYSGWVEKLHRECMAHKAENIYSLALYWKKFADLWSFKKRCHNGFFKKSWVLRDEEKLNRQRTLTTGRLMRWVRWGEWVEVRLGTAGHRRCQGLRGTCQTTMDIQTNRLHLIQHTVSHYQAFWAESWQNESEDLRENQSDTDWDARQKTFKA